jgi:uncharacterized protein
MIEVASILPSGGRVLIDGYRPGGFRVAGTAHEGPLLVWPEGYAHWAVAAVADLTLDDLAPLSRVEPAIEIVLLGCGARSALLPVVLRGSAKSMGFGIDGMATGAACRTYNLLVGEGRRVAAALLPA